MDEVVLRALFDSYRQGILGDAPEEDVAGMWGRFLAEYGARIKAAGRPDRERLRETAQAYADLVYHFITGELAEQVLGEPDSGLVGFWQPGPDGVPRRCYAPVGREGE